MATPSGGWTDFFKHIGIVSSLWHALRRLRDRMTSTELTIIEFGDDDNVLSNWTFSGVKLGTNTDARGRLYVEYTFDGTDTYTVSVYRDPSKSSLHLVAQGTLTSTSPVWPHTLSLNEMNNSGLTGSVQLDGYVSDNDGIVLVLLQGLHAQIDNLPVNEEADDDFKNDLRDLASDLYDYLDRAVSRIERFASNEMMTFIARKLKTTETSVGGYRTEESDDAISEEECGILGEFSDQLSDDGTGIVSCSPSAGSPTIDNKAGSQGDGTLSITLHDYARSGCIEFKCVDETIGSEQFSCALRTEDGDVITAANYMTIKKDFADPAVGIDSAKLTRSITDDASDGDFTNWWFNGESDSNTNDGIIYFKYTKSPAELKGYTSSSYTDDTLVCQATHSNTDGETIEFDEANGSGLTGGVTITTHPASDITFEVNLHVFKEGDVISVEVSEDTSGKLMTFFGRVFDF